MDVSTSLLDTPKRTSLQSQSVELRGILKAFEKSFSDRHGHKPKRNDIKDDPSVAAKYKRYQDLQDVLAGRLSYERLDEVIIPKRATGRTHGRHDSGVGSSPRKDLRSQSSTPKRTTRLQTLEANSLRSPVLARPELLNAIAPTPHRDGKVLGLFDLLQKSESGKSSAVTPSSTTRKRKLDELYRDTPARRSPLKIIQTPSQRSSKRQGDLLDHLEGTPQKDSNGTVVKHSRTPQSDGRKFQLSQFFATPSTQRFMFEDKEAESGHKTPLRNFVLGQTPQKQIDDIGLETTPTYLKRSTSFKDRLLSASNVASTVSKNKPTIPTQRIGPPTLRHFRSSTDNVLRITELQNQAGGAQNSSHIPSRGGEESDHDDDLDALHELEAEQQGQIQPKRPHILVRDSQHDFSFDEPQISRETNMNPTSEEHPPTRLYKKKGQKRTTRKSNIKPTAQSKPTTQPQFVAADSSDDDDNDENNDFDESDGDFSNDDMQKSIKSRSSKKAKKKQSVEDAELKTAEKPPAGKEGKKKKKQAGMINPNAQSHANFRTLKIKNKSSKANGAGRGRFAKRRK